MATPVGCDNENRNCRCLIVRPGAPPDPVALQLRQPVAPAELVVRARDDRDTYRDEPPLAERLFDRGPHLGVSVAPALASKGITGNGFSVFAREEAVIFLVQADVIVRQAVHTDLWMRPQHGRSPEPAYPMGYGGEWTAAIGWRYMNASSLSINAQDLLDYFPAASRRVTEGTRRADDVVDRGRGAVNDGAETDVGEVGDSGDLVDDITDVEVAQGLDFEFHGLELGAGYVFYFLKLPELASAPGARLDLLGLGLGGSLAVGSAETTVVSDLGPTHETKILWGPVVHVRSQLLRYSMKRLAIEIGLLLQGRIMLDEDFALFFGSGHFSPEVNVTIPLGHDQ